MGLGAAEGNLLLAAGSDLSENKFWGTEPLLPRGYLNTLLAPSASKQRDPHDTMTHKSPRQPQTSTDCKYPRQDVVHLLPPQNVKNHSQQCSRCVTGETQLCLKRDCQL